MTLAYLLRRLGAIVIVMAIVTLAVFAITMVLPGNAALMILGEHASADSLLALERQLGLDRPLWEQYFDWVWGVVHGDFGMSLRPSLPVSQVVGAAFWNSAWLALIAHTAVTVAPRRFAT